MGDTGLKAICDSPGYWSVKTMLGNYYIRDIDGWWEAEFFDPDTMSMDRSIPAGTLKRGLIEIASHYKKKLDLKKQEWLWKSIASWE
jgi:hypothetical protein